MNPGPWVHSLAAFEQSGRLQRLQIWAVQIATFLLCIVFAFLLRFDFSVPDVHHKHLVAALFIYPPVKFVVFAALGLDRGWWRFVSIYDLRRIVFGNLLAAVAAMLTVLAFAPAGFPRSLYILDFILCFLAITGERVLLRLAIDSFGSAGEAALGTRVFIYGAGSAGVTLLREIRSNPNLRYAVCGFIDDNPSKRGVYIQGIRVLGTGNDLGSLAARHRVTEVLIALPSATGAEMTDILNRCHAAEVKWRTIPALAEIIEGSGLASQIRDVALEDLLGRSPVRLDEDEIRSQIAGKVVLVTGAAGSIGSELCRQIAKYSPRRIVAFDIAESPLFEIEREMRESYPDLTFDTEIGSIQNTPRLDDVFSRYSPHAVYHAAAYKHVPLMETHVFEAVENNVFGTYNVAFAAAAHGVSDFVMISSDKAVRPTNIMGATKRVAELLLLSMQNGPTKYVAVRFGNVLGSNGSVVPIFKKQIQSGGPVTVTHPDMKRFFMTIPEACQLVLQAGVIGRGGEICVLDMGEPVRILDLANNLILLSGLRPGRDIEIRFTGIRPGEKLCEEISSALENTVPSRHEKIRIFTGSGLPHDEMFAFVDRLRTICDARAVGELIVALKDMVADYNPSANILKRSIVREGAGLTTTGSPPSSRAIAMRP